MSTHRQNLDRVEHVYVVSYDIACPKRWRQVFRTMKGYGQRLQLSVWQCRMDRARHTAMMMTLEDCIDPEEDHIVSLDLGAAASVSLRVESLGPAFEQIERRSTII